MLVDGNNFISHYLKHNKFFAAGKIGITELNLIYSFYHLKEQNKILPHIKHEVEEIAGLYPYNEEAVTFFSTELLSRLPLIDLIPRWNKVIPEFEKKIFDSFCPNAHFTLLEHLEPYFFTTPWTDYLKDKDVLVLSPFKESIDRNFKNLNSIWSGKIKNNFNLKTIKYPFAIPISKNIKYNDSIEIYNEYLDILRNEKFDIGIFGTGWTSLLFTLECKRLHKTGIHLGGATQILFGIKGQRWKEIEKFHSFFNNHWTEPLPSERPVLYKNVEGGCYW